MDVYEQINKIISGQDLLQSAEMLRSFAKCALGEKNRKAIVKVFYDRINHYSFANYYIDSKDKNYLIYDGVNAVQMYLALTMPTQGTPVKTLKSIGDFGEEIIKNYSRPVGKRITKATVIKIMSYLDVNYHFSEKVFSDRKAIILLLDYSNNVYNSECLIWITEKEVIQHLLLY